MLERLRETVVPTHKEKVVAVLYPSMVIIWASPICSTTTAACQFLMTSCQFMSIQITLSYWWKTDDLGLFLNQSSCGKPLWEKLATHSWSFSANEQGTRSWLNSWTIAAKVTDDWWKILDFLDVFLEQHIRNHNLKINKACQFLKCSLINLIWFEEFLLDNFCLLLMCLDQTVWSLHCTAGRKTGLRLTAG